MTSHQRTIEYKAEGHFRLKDASRGRFAEVFLRVEPAHAGSGIAVVDETFGGVIPRQFFPAIERGIQEALRGYNGGQGPLTDVRVIVFDGKHHPVDSSASAFEEAAKEALRDALEKAGRVSSVAKPRPPAPTVNRAASDSCPQCGFSYEWDGSSCGHCGHHGSKSSRAKVTQALKENRTVRTSSQEAMPNEIFEAAASGDYSRVKDLLQHTKDTEVLNEKGQTPLLLAALEGHVDIVQLLHDAGASLDARGTDGMGIWEIAIKNCDGALLHVLNDRGASLSPELQSTVSRLLKELPKGVSARGRRRSRTAPSSTGQGPKRGKSPEGTPSTASKKRPTVKSASTLQECRELMDLATPDLYRHNLFRVLGLPVTATSADVRRRQHRLEMQQKLGIAPSENNDGPLSLKPSPTSEDIRSAMDRLNDPQARLLDEVFWFWPTNGDPTADPALEALERGQVKQAREIWTEQAETNGQGQIATHNLAVLYHLLSLDYEARLASQGLDQKGRDRLATTWSRTFAYWRQVLDGEEFWSLVRDRVRELNDVRLTTGFVRRLRSTLAKALLLINAKIACSAAERNDAELAKRHVQLIQDFKYEEGLAEEAVRESLKAIRSHIKAAIESSKGHWTRDPRHGNEHVRQLYHQAERLLSIVDMILAAEDPIRIGLHDMVAEAMLAGEVAFAVETEDWDDSIQLLQLAQQIAVGGSLRSRLSEQTEILRERAKSGNNWCSPGYWDLPEETLSQLESIRQMAGGGDSDGAISSLVVLDPGIGKPLRRCLAYCLSLKGIQVGNEALSEYNVETGILKKILGNLQTGMGLLGRPTPSTPSYMLPPCMCCGSTYYTSWVDFTLRNVSVFMCSSCSSKHNVEIERRKSTLRKHLKTALEYLLLADEIDPGDSGVKRNLAIVKKNAQDINCSIPTTKDLKKRLGIDTRRRTRSQRERVAVQQEAKRPSKKKRALPQTVGIVVGVAAMYTFGIFCVMSSRDDPKWWSSTGIVVVIVGPILSLLLGLIAYWITKQALLKVGAVLLGLGALVYGVLPTAIGIELLDNDVGRLAFPTATILMAVGGVFLMARPKVLRLFVAGGMILPIVLSWLSVEIPWCWFGAYAVANVAMVVLLSFARNMWRRQGNPVLAKHTGRALTVYIVVYGGILLLSIASTLGVWSSVGSGLPEIVSFVFSCYPLATAGIWIWVAIIMFAAASRMTLSAEA